MSAVTTTSRFQRVSAVLGIPAAVLLALAALLKGRPPTGGASTTDVSAFFTAHHTALLVDGVVSLLAIPVLLVFFAGLRSRVAAAGAGQAAASLLLASGTLLVAVLAVQTAVFETAVQHVAVRGDAAPLRLVSDLNWMLYAAIGIGTAAVLVAATSLATTTDVLPRWTAYLSGILAVFAAVGSGGTMYDDTSSIGVLGLVAFLGMAVWVLLASTLLLAGGDDAVHAGAAVRTRVA
jgi:hypothetical protein